MIFGWRQLAKKPAASTAAVLSLALAIGSCTSVFRLIDALLLRPLPVAHAERLYAMVLRGTGPNGDLRDSGSNEYPQFLLMRKAVRDSAELIAVSWADLADLSFASDTEIGKAHRRFGRDPKAIGKAFRMGNDVYEIIGVAPKGFTGTEPGTFTDVFLPAMMYEGATHDDWSWIRTFVEMTPGGSLETVRDRLQAVWNAVQTERSKSFTSWPPGGIQKYLQQKIVLEPAATGILLCAMSTGLRSRRWR